MASHMATSLSNRATGHWSCQGTLDVDDQNAVVSTMLALILLWWAIGKRGILILSGASFVQWRPNLPTRTAGALPGGPPA